MQRMAARVLSAFLFTEQDNISMGEIADVLGVSAGSVHAATKMLMNVGLIEQVPVPASRRDHFRMRDDAWPRLFSTQNVVARTMAEAAASGLAGTARHGAARRRLKDMRDFYTFMLRELPGLVDRWRAERSVNG